MRANLRGFLLFLPLAFLVGCTTPAPSKIEPGQSVPPLIVRLMPGDEIEINFFGAPDLRTQQAIRRDGRISLQLVGDVMAAGKTVEELQEELKKKYSSQLQIQDISVILRVPPPVLVAGAVLNPGRIIMSRPLTVLDAIMEAGGFNPIEAEVRSVVLIRHMAGKRTSYIFNFKKALKGEGEDTPLYLYPFDIVYVPRTKITRLNQWVDQHINRMLPKLGVGYNSEGEVTVYR